MKLKMISHFVLGIMFFIVSHGNAQNVLLDGSFDTTTDIVPYSSGIAPSNRWNSFKNEGVDALATVKEGICDYQITNGGNYAWEVQLEQAGFPLILGHYYRLSYDVKADAERNYGLFLGEYSGSWTSLLSFDNYWQYATTEWQHFTIEFHAWSVFDYHKFSFEIGGANISMYFDNILLEDLGPHASIGIVGTALNGWDTPLQMITADGIIYTLSDVPLSAGFLKFKQNSIWDIYWGSDAFPFGTATFGGPNIPVYSGSNYDISFNRETGEYSFVCVGNCHSQVKFAGTNVFPDYTSDYEKNMWTNDGVTYTLKGYEVFDGEAKFRKEDNGSTNWGSPDFPSGTATEGDDAILVKAGFYNITFNIQTNQYSFTIPDIGIVGTALSGWTEDINMQTTDGKLYTLMNHTFKDGEVKFRLVGNWDINWGGYSFPTGYIWPDGPNIQVIAGNYNVTFNRQTGNYIFEATNCPDPVLVCPEDIYWGNDFGMCGAYVYFQDIAPSPNCGGPGISVIQTGGLANGSFFPIGTTTNTYSLTNDAGITVTCSFNIIVEDYEGPAIENTTVQPGSLWAPNHMMVPVRINYSLSDNCGGATYSRLWVVTNEDYDIVGAGRIGPDFEIIDEHNVLLKAERSGTGWGREYYIFIECWDESFIYNYQYLIVTIPHDKNELSRRPIKMEIVDSLKGKTNLKSAQRAMDIENIPLKLKVWPNPSTDLFNIEVQTTSNEAISLIVTDTNGRLISNKEDIPKGIVQLGEDLNPGIYILNVRQGNYNAQTKIVKQ